MRIGSLDFPAFYDSHYTPLAGYVWSLVRDKELAQDITQESFTRLLATWRTVAEPRPYLYQVATNLTRTTWQRNARHRAALTVLAADRVSDASAADTGLPVREAVERLPVRLRDVVLLFYYADLPVTDVAKALGRPVGTVKRLLNEARGVLAAQLGDDVGKDRR